MPGFSMTMMASREEMQWAKAIGALITVVALIFVWLATAEWLVKALNGGEPANYQQMRK